MKEFNYEFSSVLIWVGDELIFRLLKFDRAIEMERERGRER